jgi:ketol-acid reductoisomerase
MLALAAALGVLRTGAIEMSARQEALLDLFIEQSVGAVLGMAVMAAFEVGCEAGIPPEAMVMEMYASGEMESVFASFRDTGFFRASEEHGTDRALRRHHAHAGDGSGAPCSTASGQSWRTSAAAAFAQRFQAEAKEGYPMLGIAREMMRGDSPMQAAEDRLRKT